MTLLTDVRRVVYGEARLAAVPRYWRVGPVPTDDGTPFTVLARTLPFYADAVGGEAEFREAVLHVSYTLGGTFRVIPTTNGGLGAYLSPDPYVAFGVSYAVLVLPIPHTFELAQVPDGQTAKATVVVPLLRRVIVGTERGRWYLRGQSLELEVERVSPLSVGLLSLDGVRVYFEPRRRADHQFPVAGPVPIP